MQYPRRKASAKERKAHKDAEFSVSTWKKSKEGKTWRNKTGGAILHCSSKYLLFAAQYFLSCSTRGAIYELCEAVEWKSKINLRLWIRFLRYLLVRGRFCLTFRNLPELIRRPTKYRRVWKHQSCVFQICQFLLSTLASNELQSETCSKRLDTCQIVSMIHSTACILNMRIEYFR